MRRSSTRPACFSCARCVEIWLCPLARISCSSATDSSSCSSSSRSRSRFGSAARRSDFRIDAIRRNILISIYQDLLIRGDTENEHCHAEPDRRRLQSRRPVAGRLGPQGNLHRRARNARPDGHPPQVRRGEAAGRRAHHRLAAHDHPDRRADRDAGRSRRLGALGELQHLLHPGPRRRRHRRRRRAGLRLEGRIARRILVVHLPGAQPSRRPGPAARSWTTAATPRCSSTKATSSKNGSDWVNTPVRQPRRGGHQGPAEAGPRRKSRSAGTRW